MRCIDILGLNLTNEQSMNKLRPKLKEERKKKKITKVESMNSMIYSSYKNTWANHGNWNGLKWLIKSSWILTWILHKELLSLDDVLFPFKHHFFGKHRFLPVILWFLKISFFAFPYLRASDFGCSLIFQKQFALNTALEVVLTTVLGLLVIALH